MQLPFSLRVCLSAFFLAETPSLSFLSTSKEGMHFSSEGRPLVSQYLKYEVSPWFLDGKGGSCSLISVKIWPDRAPPLHKSQLLELHRLTQNMYVEMRQCPAKNVLTPPSFRSDFWSVQQLS
jgi:hypothetical protein